MSRRCVFATALTIVLVGISIFPLEVYRVEADPNYDLSGSAIQGWGFTGGSITSPGPTITVTQDELVNLTLTSADGFRHNFFLDFDGDTNPTVGESKSPDFTATVNFQFVTDTPGTFTYYCQYHKNTMYGTFKVIPSLETVALTVSILSPENRTYSANNVLLTFVASESAIWIGYSLDGQANATISGNTTLSGLSEGSHNLTVYARDSAGNTTASEMVYFTTEIPQTEPSSALIVAAALIIVLAGAALLLYFLKVRQ